MPGTQNLLDGLANPGGAEVGGPGINGHALRLLATAGPCNKFVDPGAKCVAGIDLQHALPSRHADPQRKQSAHLVLSHGVRIAAGGPDPEPAVPPGVHPAGA